MAQYVRAFSSDTFSSETFEFSAIETPGEHLPRTLPGRRYHQTATLGYENVFFFVIGARTAMMPATLWHVSPCSCAQHGGKKTPSVKKGHNHKPDGQSARVGVRPPTAVPYRTYRRHHRQKCCVQINIGDTDQAKMTAVAPSDLPTPLPGAPPPLPVRCPTDQYQPRLW